MYYVPMEIAITPEVARTIIDVELQWGQRVVAVIFNEDGSVCDHAFNWESAQNYALHEGKPVRAVIGDGAMSREDIQRLCDYDRTIYRDCFGLE